MHNNKLTEEAQLDIGGIAVLVRAETAAHLGCITTRLGEIPTEDEPEIFITIHSDSRPPGPPQDAVRIEGCDFSNDGDTLCIQLDGGARARINGSHIEMTGPAETDADQKELDDLAQFAMAVAAARSDRMMLHGATIGRAGQAMIVVGLSGRGKSTLAAATFLDGWDLLGDDLAVTWPAARRVHAVQRAPLFPRSIAEAHGLAGTTVAGKRDRLRISADVLSNVTNELVGLIEVDHDSGAGRIEIATEPDLEVFDSGLAVPPAEAVLRRHLAATAALIRLPMVRVLHASEPSIRIERAQNLANEAFDYCLAAKDR